MSGEQNKGKTYQRIPCDYCSQEIATNRMSWHYKSCKARSEYFAADRSKRLKESPIESLNLGEINEAGRQSEMVAYLERQKKQ